MCVCRLRGPQAALLTPHLQIASCPIVLPLHSCTGGPGIGGGRFNNVPPPTSQASSAAAAAAIAQAQAIAARLAAQGTASLNTGGAGPTGAVGVPAAPGAVLAGGEPQLQLPGPPPPGGAGHQQALQIQQAQAAAAAIAARLTAQAPSQAADAAPAPTRNRWDNA